MKQEAGSMNHGISKIKDFTDLYAWKEGHSLVIEVYKITKEFPTDERFGLTNQIRRAAVSITSNIAEGFSRRTYIDKAHFYSISLGSLTEVQNQLILARDLKYITGKQHTLLNELTITVNKLLNGLIKTSKLYSKNYDS